VNKLLPVKISVIVTTYNWSNALKIVLDALVAQKTTHPFEIIVADDGSGIETAKMIRDLKNRVSIPLLHIWQPNAAFRGIIRNKAILAAEGDYIIFLDGRCVPRSDFILHHVNLAEPKKFVVGNHILLSRRFTIMALSEMLALYRWPLWRWCVMWFKGVRKGMRRGHFGVWKTDLININGWEENLKLHAYEDFDMNIRLLRSGVRRKSCWFMLTVMEFWHPENYKNQEPCNKAVLKAKLTDIQLYAEKGLSQYAI
jgi:glycosyltransferase involved in cell wall biosynthesis